MDERIYSKNIIEFVTVSAEYCAFIERVPELEKEEFLDKITKILPLLSESNTINTGRTRRRWILRKIRHREYVRERSGKHRKSIGGRRQLSGSFSKRYEIQ